MALEQFAVGGHVPGVTERGGDVEMIAPAGELEAVVSKGLGLGRQVRNRQIGPLTGEQGDRTTH